MCKECGEVHLCKECGARSVERGELYNCARSVQGVWRGENYTIGTSRKTFSSAMDLRMSCSSHTCHSAPSLHAASVLFEGSESKSERREREKRLQERSEGGWVGGREGEREQGCKGEGEGVHGEMRERGRFAFSGFAFSGPTIALTDPGPSQARQLRLLTRARRSGALALESCRFRRRCRRCPAATERSKHTRGQKRAKQRKIADNWRQCLGAANLPETMMVRRSAGCSGSTTKDPAWKKSVCIWISNCSHEHGSQIELDC